MRKGIRRYLKDAFYADQAMSLLHRITQARAAAGGRTHGEALHDWRVLGRRLIEFTRLWARKPLRRQVLPLVNPWIEATNAARDAEVEAELIAALRQGAPPEWAGPLDRLAQANTPVLREESERLAGFLADPVRQDEERRLEEMLGSLPRFPHVPRRLPKRLRSAIDRFHEIEASRPATLKAWHALRLAGKGVRYGFEPLVALEPELKPLLAELTALQRSLGEHRDWTRLAEKSREAGFPEALIREMAARAEKSLEARPRQFKEIAALLENGWSAPPLGARTLRRRLLREAVPQGEAEGLKAALKLAAEALKGHKRGDGNALLVHPLRAALSLAEEGGVRTPEVLAAAVLAGALAGGAGLSEDALAERFDPLTLGIVLALDPGEEPAEEHRERLRAAPSAARVIALALELERLRFIYETGRPRRECRRELERIRDLLPLAHEGALAGAGGLAGQAGRLLDLFPDAG